MSSSPPTPTLTSPLVVAKGEDEKSQNGDQSPETASVMVPAATEGYVFVLRDPEKRAGEFMLGRVRKPVEDLKRVNAPWTPDHQRYHSLTLVYLVRVLDMAGVQAAACKALVDELGMVQQDGATIEDATGSALVLGDGGPWLRNPQSKKVEQLSMCVKKAADRWHAANADQCQGSVIPVEGGSDTKSPKRVRIKWRYRELERNVSLLERLMGDGDDSWC